MWVQEADEGKRRSLFLTDKRHKISMHGISYKCTLRYATAKNGQDQLCTSTKSALENKQPPSRHNYCNTYHMFMLAMIVSYVFFSFREFFEEGGGRNKFYFSFIHSNILIQTETKFD